MPRQRGKSRPSSSPSSLTSSSGNGKSVKFSTELVEFFPQKNSPPTTTDQETSSKKKKGKKKRKEKEEKKNDKEEEREQEEEEHEQFKRQLKQFLIEHTPVYGPLWLKYGFLAAFLLWLILSFGVFGYVYKGFVFGALSYENDKAPADDLLVVEKLMDARMDHYVSIPLEKNEPITRHHIPLWEALNARYTIVRHSEPTTREDLTPVFSDDGEFLEYLAKPKKQVYESSFWQCFSMVHLIGAAMIQVVFCGATITGWVFYYVFGYRLFALFKNISWVRKIRENPSLFLTWYVVVGLIGCGYLYKIAIYTMAVFNTSFNNDPEAFTVANLGLDPENYSVLLSFASASFNIISDGQGVKYYSNSFWTFWDGAHLVGSLGVQAIICIAVPVYRKVAWMFWAIIRLLFSPVLGQYRHVKKKVKRD